MPSPEPAPSAATPAPLLRHPLAVGDVVDFYSDQRPETPLRRGLLTETRPRRTFFGGGTASLGEAEYLATTPEGTFWIVESDTLGEPLRLPGDGPSAVAAPDGGLSVADQRRLLAGICQLAFVEIRVVLGDGPNFNAQYTLEEWRMAGQRLGVLADICHNLPRLVLGEDHTGRPNNGLDPQRARRLAMQAHEYGLLGWSRVFEQLSEGLTPDRYPNLTEWESRRPAAKLPTKRGFWRAAWDFVHMVMLG